MWGKIIFSLLGILVWISFFLLFQNIDLDSEMGDCYDYYGNKIIGERCVIEAQYSSQTEANITAIGFGGFMFLLLLLFGFVIDDIFSNKSQCDRTEYY